MAKIQAIILAGGSGRRFGGETPKQFLEIAGKTLLERAAESFAKHAAIDSVIVVVPPGFEDRAKALLPGCRVVIGGETRAASSYAGVLACEGDADYVMIHDGARPFVSEAVISRVAEALARHDAVIPAIAVTDAVVRAGAGGVLETVLDRSALRRVQTPQGFRKSLIKVALARHMAEGEKDSPDDAGLIIKYCLGNVYIVDGDEKNIKVTYPEDLERYEIY